MKISMLNLRRGSPGQRGPCLLAGLARQSRGFTLLEALVALAAAACLFMALYSGVTFGILEVRRSREDLQATQLIMSKAELMRLYGWSQQIHLRVRDDDRRDISPLKKLNTSYFPLPGLAKLASTCSHSHVSF